MMSMYSCCSSAFPFVHPRGPRLFFVPGTITTVEANKPPYHHGGLLAFCRRSLQERSRTLLQELLGDDVSHDSTGAIKGEESSVTEPCRLGERMAALEQLAETVGERFGVQRAVLEEELGALGQALGAVAEQCEQVDMGYFIRLILLFP